MGAYFPEDAVYWLWLQRRLGIPSRTLPAVMGLDGGARRVYESTPDELWRMGLFSVRTINALNDRSLDMDERTLRRCADSGISVTVPGDVNYPAKLYSLPDPPAVLFYRGRLSEMACRPCIALVGTRKATDYGMRAAEELALRLSRAGATVVSGCARGIDTAAHNGALLSEGQYTIAVLGCGIDYRYNMENELLRRRIAGCGALISEYPPDYDASPRHFPVRNRIISGLSLGTVVIEADAKSGSLITANLALEQGRDLYVMPAGLGMPNSSGIHRLVREGAKQIESPLDILAEYAPMYPGVFNLRGTELRLMFGQEPQPLTDAVPEPAEDVPDAAAGAAPESEPPDFLSEGARKMYQYLRTTPQLADNLARQASVAPDEAMILLSELELYGCAAAHPGGRYSLK